VTLNNNGTGSDVSNNAIAGNINCNMNTGGVSDTRANTIAEQKMGQCSTF
jgi:hypothetical protein